MAAIARDNLDIIRIPRKVILTEVLKRIGGSEAEYDSMIYDGRYFSTVRTIIKTTEPDTSGKLEQAIGSFAERKEDAEEAGALALIEVLKRIYRFELDDMNFIERARNERRKEQLERDVSISARVQNEQAEKIRRLNKGWNQLIDDMDFVQEVCEDLCGAALATFPAEDVDESHTEIMHGVYCLNEWTEQKIFESTANLMDSTQ